MQSTNDIRQTFLNYFAKNGHEVLPSGPLVPHNDPTLMFTNAGMVQFKNIFIGQETRDYSRAVTSQKCVRAGGKHNDLENVGYTARHHTFFEMLGNFSFGDYFKDLAIELAWNLVTKEFGLPEEKLLVTVYADDTQAFDLWKKISGLSDSRIIRISTSDNFWSMGEIGPCGPCSEIFFDHGDHIPGGPPGSPDEDGELLIRGDLRLDTTRHECVWRGIQIQLTVTEFLLLYALVKYTGHVKSRDQLMDAAYGDNIYVDDRTIDSHIKRLRRKFKAADREFAGIETLYGLGYRFQEQ